MRFLLALFALMATAHASAQLVLRPKEAAQPAEDTFTFAWENDAFAPQRTTDRWYTNGLHAAWNYKPGAEPFSIKEVHSVARWLFRAPEKCLGKSPDTDDRECSVRVTYGLGQNMYTPTDITQSGAQEFDRPWAGWLYAGAGLTYRNSNHIQVAAYKMGPTGPGSLAGDVQIGWHRLLHLDHPAGWANQLRPKFGVQLSYLSARLFQLTEADTFGLQFSLGGLFGNLRRVARVSTAVVWSPSGGFGDVLAGTLDEGEFLIPESREALGDGTVSGVFRRGIYFVHLQGAAVAHNEFLTGRTFGTRPQIEPIVGVYTATLGFTVPFGPGTKGRIGWAYKVRSPEFRVTGQSQKDAYQRWAAITYSQHFQ
jgi:hypothetical protein